MKKITYFLYFLISASVVFYSCHEDFLEEDIRSQASDGYLSTSEGWVYAINAGYSYVRFLTANETGVYMMSAGTDTWTHGMGGNYAYSLYNANLNPADWVGNWVWDTYYQAINTVNAVIDRAPNVDGISEDLKNIRIAEARFLRAYYYFYLVRHWGPVHLSLEETQGVEREAIRAPRADIYEAIINDLNIAAQALPVVASDYGRATKPAAEHLLALVYLTKAGFSDAAQPGDYNNAAQLAKNVIHNYNFRLLDDFADVFKFDADRHEEVIWAIQNSKDIQTAGFGGNWLHALYLPRYENLPGLERSMELGRAWSRLRPTRYTYEELWDRQIDSRAEATFSNVFYCNSPGTYNSFNGLEISLALGDTAAYFPVEPWSAEQIQNAGFSVINPNAHTLMLYPRIIKFTDPDRIDIMDMRGSRDVLEMRLGETYLIAAEALMMINELDEAATYFNAVRTRAANEGAVELMQITPGQLNIDLILDERARELMGELKRWFDLVRTGKLIERNMKYNPDAAKLIQDYHVLRPIPLNQIDRSTTDFGQNTGY